MSINSQSDFFLQENTVNPKANVNKIFFMCFFCF
jgi:hypothetical protein